MCDALKLLVAILLCAQYVPAQTASTEGGAKAIVLQKNEGELRTRRPREGVASPSSDFLLKVSPKTNGSKHLLLGTEEIPPGAVIPKHKHHGEDEILLIQTGSAHVWLGDKEYDAHPGALVFIPAETWIGMKNTEPGEHQPRLCLERAWLRRNDAVCISPQRAGGPAYLA